MSQLSKRASVVPLSDDAFLTHAARAAHPLPMEQTPLWASYDATVEGRTPWRRLGVTLDGDDAPVAVVAFTEYAGRGFRYLWAKHGPVWLGEQTPAAEQAVRAALLEYVTREAPHIAFLRLHFRYLAPALSELLQTVTYDRTVIIDVAQEPDALLASLSKKFRYEVRQAVADDATVVTDETGLTAEQFGELYSIYRETADRDAFGIYDADVYFGMLEALGGAARVFVARRTDAGPDGQAKPGRAVAWLITTISGTDAVYYFAAGNAEARETRAAIRLLWDTIVALRARGVTRLDLMGVDSPRAPSLAGVGLFKRKWGQETEVDGAWDVPVNRRRYRLLKLALRAKRLLRR